MTEYTPTERPFRIVLPKKGRLVETFMAVADGAGLSLQKSNPRHDYGCLRDLREQLGPVEALLQNGADALASLADGVADMAVTGLDTFIEFNNAARADGLQFDAQITATLDIGACGLYFAGPASRPLNNPSDLNGLRIATSYPATVRAWFNDHNLTPARIIARKGGVEDMIRLGLADAVCDLVETGNTLKACALTPGLKLFDSSAVIITRCDISSRETAQITAALTKRLARQSEPAEYDERPRAIDMIPAYAPA